MSKKLVVGLLIATMMLGATGCNTNNTSSQNDVMVENGVDDVQEEAGEGTSKAMEWEWGVVTSIKDTITFYQDNLLKVEALANEYNIPYQFDESSTHGIRFEIDYNSTMKKTAEHQTKYFGFEIDCEDEVVELSLYAEENYPIGETENVDFADSFAGKVYTSVIQDIPVPIETINEMIKEVSVTGTEEVRVGETSVIRVTQEEGNIKASIDFNERVEGMGYTGDDQSYFFATVKGVPTYGVTGLIPGEIQFSETTTPDAFAEQVRRVIGSTTYLIEEDGYNYLNPIDSNFNHGDVFTYSDAEHFYNLKEIYFHLDSSENPASESDVTVVKMEGTVDEYNDNFEGDVLIFNGFFKVKTEGETIDLSKGNLALYMEALTGIKGKDFSEQNTFLNDNRSKRGNIYEEVIGGMTFKIGMQDGFIDISFEAPPVEIKE